MLQNSAEISLQYQNFVKIRKKSTTLLLNLSFLTLRIFFAKYSFLIVVILEFFKYKKISKQLKKNTTVT